MRVCRLCGKENPNHWQDFCVTLGCSGSLVNDTKVNNGGSSSYYELPEGATQLQDLIEYQNMNANRKEVFKAAWRVGSKEGNNHLYDWNKIVFFGLREIGRISKRKDYLTIANENIGDQSVDNQKQHFAKMSTNVLKTLVSVPEALYETQLLAIYEVLGERGVEYIKREAVLELGSAFDMHRTCPNCGGLGYTVQYFSKGLTAKYGCGACNGTGFYTFAKDENAAQATPEESSEEVKEEAEEVSPGITGGGAEVGEDSELSKGSTWVYGHTCDHTEVCDQGYSEAGKCAECDKPDNREFSPGEEPDEEHF